MERKVLKKVKGFRTKDGAGVSLVRVLGNETVREYDPILMLDSFDSTNPDDYLAGFPMHPHRGIETITYLKYGSITHKDSMGNTGTMTDGEIQWMTTGSGILHEEMPQKSDRMLGVQIWLNLPKENKMVQPKYKHIKKDEIKSLDIDSAKIKVLCGEYDGVHAYKGEYLPFDFYEITLDANKEFDLKTDKDSSVTVFFLENDGYIAKEKIDEKTAVLTAKGEYINLKAGEKETIFLVMISKELKESIAWGGPVVMNTNQELQEAFAELRNGTFLKKQAVDI